MILFSTTDQVGAVTYWHYGDPQTAYLYKVYRFQEGVWPNQSLNVIGKGSEDGICWHTL